MKKFNITLLCCLILSVSVFSQTENILGGLTPNQSSGSATIYSIANISDEGSSATTSNAYCTGDQMIFEYQLDKPYLISDPAQDEIIVQALCYGVKIWVRENSSEPWIQIGYKYGSTSSKQTLSFNINYHSWIQEIKFEVIKIYGSPSTLRVYDIKVNATDDPSDGYFNRVGIGTNNISEYLNVNGNTLTKRLIDYDDEMFYLDPASTSTALKTRGTLSGTKFIDYNNSGFYLDPSSTSTALSTCGTLKGTKLIDYDNAGFYLDPSNSSVSLSAAGEIIGKSLIDYNNSNYYLDPSNTGVAINIAGKIQAETNSDNPLVFRNTEGGYQYISFYTNSTRKAWIGINDNSPSDLWLRCESGRVGMSGTDIYISGENFKVSNGYVYAREIKVTLDNPFPDFVFDLDYELRTLNEVEEYIALNGHLPDVPSQEDVEEEGINLGEMDAILLQKIEELTLYMIELKKENEMLKEEINILKIQ